MIDTPSYLNAKKDAHWPTRLSPPTFLKVDQQVAAGLHPYTVTMLTNIQHVCTPNPKLNENTENEK